MNEIAIFQQLAKRDGRRLFANARLWPQRQAFANYLFHPAYQFAVMVARFRFPLQVAHSGDSYQEPSREC